MQLSNLHEAIVITDNSEQGYDRSQSSPEAIRRRSERNKARRRLEKAGRVHKGDGKHVHHKRPLSRGGSNGNGNLAVVDAKSNWREGRKVSAANQRRHKHR